MISIPAMPANSAAERIVRHFQAAGFSGITEALVIRIRLKKEKADRHEVEATFDRAADLHSMPPLADYFEIRPYGFYSELRGFAQAKAELQSDFGVNLRRKVPSIYFDVAPVVIDDALATGHLGRAFVNRDEIAAYVADEETQASSDLREFSKSCELSNVRPVAQAVRRSIERDVLDAADKWDAQLIVVGAGQKRFLEAVMLGSVAEGVLRDSERDVLVIPSRVSAS